MTRRQPRPGFDGQARTALIGGTLLILISFIRNDGDLNLLRFAQLPLHEQVGVSLHLAALAVLVGVDEVFSVGVIELASGAARRYLVENACLIAQCRFLLSGTTRNRLQLNQALAPEFQQRPR